MKQIVFLLCALGALVAGAEARKPNVILIMADDLGFRDLGCQGHPTIQTPVLDKLAAGGVRCTDFHSGATVCTPSRMALLTGSYPSRLGWQRGVGGYLMGMKDGMSTEALTIAEIFRAEGYATGISGKWHVGDMDGTRPMDQGFYFCYYTSHSNNQVKQVRRGTEIDPRPFENRLLTERFTEAALEFIRGQKDKPFFLYLPYTAPHFPVEAHPEWKGRSRYGVFGDVVEELDFRIGTIVETLDELGLAKDTIVVFTSDNGPNPKEASSPLPYRGEKWSALEGGTRVPCIVSWPGTVPAGKTCDGFLAAIDLMPTLCRAAGIEGTKHDKELPPVDGLDAWDYLIGNGKGSPRTELLYWHGREPEPQAIRMGQWKLFPDRRHALQGPGTDRASDGQFAAIRPLRDALAPDGPAVPILFDLSADEGETRDVSAQHPGKVGELRQRMDALVADIKSSKVLPLATPKGGG